MIILSINLVMIILSINIIMIIVLQRNGTSWADGQLRMHTGAGDIERLGDIITHNGANTTHAYPGHCARITGSADGLLSPGKLRDAGDFDIWSTDICRKLTFKNVGWTSKHGIKLMKYSLSENVFDNGTKCKVSSTL